MFYKFPEIKNIDDVLPHIEGRKEFIVADKGDYVIVNYVVATPNTFDLNGDDDLGGAIRRECRGLAFYPDGRIMSRPFHKFFNIGEREETQPKNIDMNSPHVIMEKMDGSMIRPIMVGGEMRLGTKMGVTDIAMEAEKWLNDKSYIARDNILGYVNKGYTPIFEWIGPENKIVIDYAEPKLVMLAIRHNVTGEYFMPRFQVFDMPELYGSVSNIEEYVAKHVNDVGREGFIARFANGHMFKGKNSWYVRVHKTKDRIRTERHVINIILNEELDDLLPLLDENDHKMVVEVEKKFWTKLYEKEKRLQKLYKDVSDKSKKEFALEIVPKLKAREDASFIFAMKDGKELRTLVLKHALSSTSNEGKYERFLEWVET